MRTSGDMTKKKSELVVGPFMDILDLSLKCASVQISHKTHTEASQLAYDRRCVRYINVLQVIGGESLHRVWNEL